MTALQITLAKPVLLLRLRKITYAKRNELFS